MSAFLADFREMAPDKLKPHQHAGVEFIYLVKGSLVLKISGEEHVLEAEDAIYFDSAVLHSYRERGSKACPGVVVTIP